MSLSELLRTIEASPGRLVVHILFTILVAALVTIVLRVVIDIVVRRVISHHPHMKEVEKKKRGDTLASVFHASATVIVWVVTLFVILSQLNVNLAAAVTGAGVLGVVVGFGAQNLVSDILAGVFIIGENQYRVGDIVTLRAGGRDVSGVVETIGIRITRLRDLDGNLHTVRNGLADVVSNLSFDYANVNVDVGVAYEADVDKVEQILNEVGVELAEDPAWASSIIEPIQFLRLDGFEDSAVRIKSLGKVEAAKQWDVAGEYRRRIKKAFEANDISIPFPQIDVHTAAPQHQISRHSAK